MKYYKLINQQGWGKNFILNKIYSENWLEDSLWPTLTTQYYAKKYTNSWQEVSEQDYNIQEGIITELPEEYVVDCSDDNSKSAKVFEKLYGYITPMGIANYAFYTKEVIKKERGYKLYGIDDSIPSSCKQLPIFTYKQWKELMDKKEEFKLPERWHLKVNSSNLDFLKSLSNYKHLNLGDYSSIISINSGLDTRNVPKGSIEISLEYFKAHVLKINNQEKMKKVIGYKLKDDCKQYKGAINQICDTIDFDFKRCAEKSDSMQSGITLLKNAGVLTLWFEEVYEDEFKVGDWVITKGYSSNYDGKALKITKIYGGFDEAGYVNFEPNKDPHDNFSLNMIERKATPEEIAKAIEKVLYFGDVKFTIKQGNDFAITSHGNIPKSDISKALSYIDNPPKLKGFSLNIHDNEEGERYDICNLDDAENVQIGFGCTAGKVSQLRAIYNAFE